MSKLTIFELRDCPYCRSARQAAAELEKDPAYRDVEVEWIDESLESDLADRYDYYFVPSVFLGEEKIYECSPGHDDAAILAGLRQGFDRAR